ncbi:hypothetical protein GCM10023081_04850 [Arthrobacter ginkgonis]|uniref:Uncharacterized protein n=1 Tax=Arthrobacter ginkgonis TaxID=1630594 RepID=A0ABP7BTQ7_9MICC
MSLAGRLNRFADPRALEYGVTSSAVLAALSLPDPARLSPGRRAALHGAIALLSGALMLVELRKTDLEETGPLLDPLAKGALAAGAAGVALGLARPADALDARIQGLLVRRGVPKPRVILAVGSAALGLATFLADRALAARESGDGANDDDGGPRQAELDPALRTLMEGILAQPRGQAKTALRAQLAGAREEVWGEPEGFDSMLEFAVDPDAPLAVPHDFTYPVRARFTAPSGVPLEVILRVSGGRLASLAVDVAEDTPELEAFIGEDPFEGLEAWPEPGAVSYVVETAEGLRPLG